MNKPNLIGLNKMTTIFESILSPKLTSPTFPNSFFINDGLEGREPP
jgi:hypothetical protein